MRSKLLACIPRRALVCSLLAVLTPGCGADLPMTPAHGRITYQGEPLKFGVVMLHPAKGQIAQAEIAPDGTFQFSTFGDNDGVVPGSYKVSVLCAEGHDPNRRKSSPGEAGMSLGRSLIPLNYTRASSSGLTATVSENNRDEIVLEL